MTSVRAFGAGFARDRDLTAAARQAVADALEQLGDADRQLATVFVAGGEPEEMGAALAAAAEALGAEHLIGCTAGGVLGVDDAAEADPAVSVWVASLPGATVRAFHLEVIRTETEVAVLGMPGRRLNEALAVLLVDPWSFPVDGFLSRSAESLPGLGIIGGMASSPGGPGANRLLIDGRVVDRGAVGIFIGGDTHARPVVSQGCRPIGPVMVVTRAEGTDILELAGARALDRLTELVAGLDPAEKQLVAGGLQLGIALDEYADSHGHGDYLVRAVLGTDPSTGAVRIADPLMVGQSVRFHVRDAAAADHDLKTLLAAKASKAAGILLFSCNGRGAGLFSSADHDAVVAGALPYQPAVAGFFAAGELGPVGGRNQVHAFTASMLVFDGP